MSKTSRLPARHGEDHNPDGYDPIPALDGLIRFDFDNQGGYLYVTANNAIPGEGDESIIIRANVSDEEVPIGGDLTISAENVAELTADGQVTIDAPVVGIVATVSPITIVVNGTTFNFQDDGNIVVT